MKRILFLSSIFSRESEAFFRENSKGATSNANNSFQWSLIKGMEENGYIVDVITAPNIGAFPTRFSILNIRRSVFTLDRGGRGISLPWFNMLFIKHFFIYRSLYAEVKKAELSQYEAVIVYDLYPPFYKIFAFINAKRKSLKIINIVPDIVGMTRGNSSALHRVFDSLSLSIIRRGMNFVNGYVYLTKYMPEKMPIHVQKAPSIVIEGICNPDISQLKDIPRINNKYFFYSGSLDLRHGIGNLIEAYVSAEGIDTELWICGDGDGRETVEAACKHNPTIKYLGQLSRKEVIKLQASAFLLINPRTSEGEFTKYSFPSKIIEYYLSGRPTFMYELEGIPKEYFDFCFSTNNESIQELSLILKRISSLEEDYLTNMGRNAKDFVLNNKNARIQIQKIFSFIDSL